MKIRDFSKLGKKTPRRTHRIKNHLVWISIREEMEQILGRKFDLEEREFEKTSKN